MRAVIMLVHWVLIAFVYSSGDTIASTKIGTYPLDYGAVFSTQDACDGWAREKLADIKRIESFVCLPRPAYRN